MSETDAPSPSFPLQSLINSVDTGAPLPPVDATDLKQLFEMYRSLPPNKAYGVDVLKPSLSSGANPEATTLRCMMLLPLLETGDLSAWQHGTELDDVVYQVAATFEVDRSLTVFPGNAIVDELRKRRAATSS